MSKMEKYMEYDDAAFDRSDAIWEDWKWNTLFREENKPERYHAIGRFIAKHHRGVPVEVHAPKKGSYNTCIRVEFLDGTSALIRFACPGTVMAPEEKTWKEVDVMRFIEQQTTIPVPHVLHYGTKAECPNQYGPFIVMEYSDHVRSLVGVLNMPGRSEESRPILDPKISDETLENAYSQMADVLLQLAQHSFDRIGSLVQKDEEGWTVGDWPVASRPWTFNMNSLVQLGNFPPDQLHPPTATFSTSTSYYAALAETHLTHLSTQHNDAITSASDCRRKFVARCLFRKLIRDAALKSATTDAGPFHLFCDDLRPANVLVDKDDRITAVIDWEFAYAAPSEFAHSPPWWLLVEMPEYWPMGLAHWTTTFEARLPLFLAALERREAARLASGALGRELKLAERMRENWDSGMFWVVYAARKSWAFDMVFWEEVKPRFFGEAAGFEELCELLTGEEREAMERLVERKVGEMGGRRLVDWEKEKDVGRYVFPFCEAAGGAEATTSSTESASGGAEATTGGMETNTGGTETNTGGTEATIGDTKATASNAEAASCDTEAPAGDAEATACSAETASRGAEATAVGVEASSGGAWR